MASSFTRCPDLRVDFATDQATRKPNNNANLLSPNVSPTHHRSTLTTSACLDNAAAESPKRRQPTGKYSFRERSSRKQQRTPSPKEDVLLVDSFRQNCHIRSHQQHPSSLHNMALPLDQRHLGVPRRRKTSRSAEHLDNAGDPGGGSMGDVFLPSPINLSPHHSRSQSVRSPKKTPYLSPPRSTPRPRPRGTSLPLPSADNVGGERDDYYLLRHFIVNGKHVVNRGDSFRNRHIKSPQSVASSTSDASTENMGGSPPSEGPSSRGSSVGGRTPPFRVLMMGAQGVGKTTLTAQFMTSEYLHTYDLSLDEDSAERSVSVLLDGEESELTFIDHRHGEISPENSLCTYSPHAFIVVYSVVERRSLRHAEDILQWLWRSNLVSSKAVILVGNKADLVRARQVQPHEGKSLAVAYDCKFIETSSGIQHNVDELLVGILKQIRLKAVDPEAARSLFRKRSNRKKQCGISAPKFTPRASSFKMRGLLNKVWCTEAKSKSCEDLHVL